jgi:UDP-N-acetylglucosamine--N-acetylmuramyl-(pentapeptide) pyrophosphoryl-undecaprenol N-acetylglucosamine transferase
MRVQFAPCGIGLGHAGRCIPIAKEMQRQKSEINIYFSTYNEAVNYIRKEGFLTIEVPAMEFKVKPDGTVDIRKTAIDPGPFIAPFNFLEQLNKEIEIMETYEPDVIVSDSRASPLVAARILNKPSICILNQFQVIIPRKTQYLRLAKFADMSTLTILGKIWTSGVKTIIPDFPPPYTISSNNLHIPKAYQKKTELIGPILPIHPNTLASKQQIRKKLGLQRGKPIIFVPISGPPKERKYLVERFKKIYPDLQEKYQIVMSLGIPDASEKPESYGDFTIYNWLSNRFEYLKACDIVISRAGHGTLSQSISYGKPLILVPTPNHTEQHNNAKKCEELGVALIINQDSLNKNTLKTAIKKILTQNYREKAREIQSEVSEVDGLSAAIKAIFEAAKGERIHVPA